MAGVIQEQPKAPEDGAASLKTSPKGPAPDAIGVFSGIGNLEKQKASIKLNKLEQLKFKMELQCSNLKTLAKHQ